MSRFEYRGITFEIDVIPYHMNVEARAAWERIKANNTDTPTFLPTLLNLVALGFPPVRAWYQGKELSPGLNEIEGLRFHLPPTMDEIPELPGDLVALWFINAQEESHWLETEFFAVSAAITKWSKGNV